MISVANLSAVCLIAVASASFAADKWDVRPNGIGPVKVGMKLSELKTGLRLSYSIEMAEDSDQSTCFYADLRGRPGIALMILNGRVARVDVDNQLTQTVEGIHNGDLEAHAMMVYGKRMKVAPSAYAAAEGHYLTVRSPDGRNGIRFETQNGKIVRYYAGRLDAISFIEGCE